MPLELPGVPLGVLPDKKHSGRCPNCRRTYRSVKVLKTGRKKYLCPYCGKRIPKKALKNDQ